MRLRTTTITTFIITLAFFSLGPLLILWTAGYRYNARTQRLQETGILLLATKPEQNADIAIGDNKLTVKTPARITGLLTRNYTVSVTKNGYFPWQQTMQVDAGRTTFADRIRLFPSTAPIRIFSKPVKTLALSPDNSLLAFTTSSTNPEVWTAETKTNTQTLLHTFASSTINALSWSANNVELLIKTTDKNGTHYEIFGNNTATPINIPHVAAMQVAWSIDDPRTLIASTIDAAGTPSLYELRTTGAANLQLWSATSTPKNLTSPLSAYLSNNIVYLAVPHATSTIIFAIHPGVPTVAEIHRFPGTHYSFLRSVSPYLVLRNDTKEALTVLQEETGKLVTETKGTQLRWSTLDPTHALTNDDVEVNEISLNDPPLALSRIGNGIRAVEWAKDAAYALVLTNTSLHTFDDETYFGTHEDTELATFTTTSDLAVTLDAAYVAGVKDGQEGIFKVVLR